MKTVYFYDMQGELVTNFINGEEIRVDRVSVPQMIHETATLVVKEYIHNGKCWCIAGVDERDRLSVLKNMIFDVHISQEFYDREFYDRQVDIKAMLIDRLSRKLAEKLKDRITFTTIPSHMPNYKIVIASI